MRRRNGFLLVLMLVLLTTGCAGVQGPGTVGVTMTPERAMDTVGRNRRADWVLKHREKLVDSCTDGNDRACQLLLSFGYGSYIPGYGIGGYGLDNRTYTHGLVPYTGAGSTLNPVGYYGGQGGNANGRLNKVEKKADRAERKADDSIRINKRVLRKLMRDGK